MTTTERLSTRNAMRPFELRRTNKVTKRNNPTRKPAIFTMVSDRVTIDPAISPEFGRSKDLKTEKAAGATTAPKKSAAPSHIAKSINLTNLIIPFAPLVSVIPFSNPLRLTSALLLGPQASSPAIDQTQDSQN